MEGEGCLPSQMYNIREGSCCLSTTQVPSWPAQLRLSKLLLPESKSSRGNTNLVHGSIPLWHGRLGIQFKSFKHHQHPSYGVVSVGRRERGTSHLVWFEQSLDVFSKFCWWLNIEQNRAFQSGPKSNVEWNGAFSLGHSEFEPWF